MHQFQFVALTAILSIVLEINYINNNREMVQKSWLFEVEYNEEEISASEMWTLTILPYISYTLFWMQVISNRFQHLVENELYSFS